MERGGFEKEKFFIFDEIMMGRVDYMRKFF